MQITKPLDMDLLARELTAASVPYNGLHFVPGDQPPNGELYTTDDGGARSELPPAAGPVVDAHDATPRAKTFEAAEDVERLALVTERAQTDPAFAALAELTLGKQGV